MPHAFAPMLSLQELFVRRPLSLLERCPPDNKLWTDKRQPPQPLEFDARVGLPPCLTPSPWSPFAARSILATSLHVIAP